MRSFHLQHVQEEPQRQVPLSLLSNKESISDNFLLAQPMYDMTPPPPFPFPKLFHYSLDPSRHYHHKFTSSFLTALKPLTIGCDVGLPVD